MNVTSGRATTAATASGSRSTRQQRTSAATAAVPIAIPSHTPGRCTRRSRAAASVEPIASPVMKATSIALNAYVVGPRTVQECGSRSLRKRGPRTPRFPTPPLPDGSVRRGASCPHVRRRILAGIELCGSCCEVRGHHRGQLVAPAIDRWTLGRARRGTRPCVCGGPAGAPQAT